MATSANKSTPYIPLAGGADDGWSKEDYATATCYCGAVQLEFVSVTLADLIIRLHISNHINTANPRPRPRQHVCLQLHRLPQNHRIHVRV